MEPQHKARAGIRMRASEPLREWGVSEPLQE